jgi:hypothetical protein
MPYREKMTTFQANILYKPIYNIYSILHNETNQTKKKEKNIIG